jgi:hypothetical protein
MGKKTNFQILKEISNQSMMTLKNSFKILYLNRSLIWDKKISNLIIKIQKIKEGTLGLSKKDIIMNQIKKKLLIERMRFNFQISTFRRVPKIQTQDQQKNKPI